MTLPLLLLPLCAFLGVAGGLSVVPLTGLLTAWSAVALHRFNPDFDSVRMILVVTVTLIISCVPAWKLSSYANDQAGQRRGAALFLALCLSVAVSVSLPAGEVVTLSSFLPVSPAAVPASLTTVFAGLAALALRQDMKARFAGLLTASDGILLVAANAPHTGAVWVACFTLLLLAGAGLLLTARLSLLKDDAEGQEF